MNAVESLFVRLSIAQFYPVFQQNGIDKIVSLRNLTEEQLNEFIPEDAARATLNGAINKVSEPPAPAGASAPPQYNEAPDYRRPGKGDAPREGASGERRPRPKRSCRDYFDHGCSYGDECRFSHDQEQHTAETGDEGGAGVVKDSFKEDISVPWDSVKLLLGNKAEKLNRINYRCATTNSRIERPEAFHQTYTFTLRGTKEGVKRAKAEIEQFVGITGSKNREARFQYANNELERNEVAAAYAVAANEKNKDTPFGLSENVLKSLVSTFRFQHAPKFTQFWTLSSHGTDKDKYETLIPLLSKFKGIQVIIFAEPNRVEEMQKRSKQTAEALGVKNPQFVHRKLSKEDRMKALEAFKKGEVNENGIIDRVLVTNNDYAKLARKVLIPYVNVVVHFSIPKNKEQYLHQSMCTGRGGKEGATLLFITHHDATTQKEWSASLPLNELAISDWETAVAGIEYDTEQSKLTPARAEPADNWRELLQAEVAEKAAAKAEKAAAKAAAAQQ